MTVHATTLDTPLGPFAMLAADDVLVAAGFTDVADQHGRLDPARRARPLRVGPDLGPLSAAVQRYFAGELDALADVPVDQPGGAFRQAAWKAMRAVPAGEVVSYRELAARAGRPDAVRAAGSACARNLVAVVVPCHRVVRSGGALGGYYYGLDVKRRLLAHERAAPPDAATALF